MRIDNSQDVAFHFCPAKWYEKYVNKLERDWRKVGEPATTSFGSRMHEVLEDHYKSLGLISWAMSVPELNTPYDEAIEIEAQKMFGAYQQHYPGEPEQFVLNTGGTPRAVKIIDVERAFELPLPESEGDTYTGKFDLVIEDAGTLHLVDHKTEKRGGKSNDPRAWAARYQVGRYLWAAQQIYGQPFGSIILNVLTRQSEKGQKPETFRRDRLERSPEQIAEAMENLVATVQDMKRLVARAAAGLPLLADRENCYHWGYACDYADVHLLGRTPENLAKFRPTEEYLDL